MTTTNMKAMVATGYGSPEVLQLQQISRPKPKSNEILVQPSNIEENNNKKREWPESMKNWVRLSFEQCDSEREKDKMEEKLKVFVNTVLNNGSAWTINWSLKKLFQ